MCLEKKFGLTHAEAMKRCFFMDSKGLVTKARLEKGDFAKQTHKIPFAHDVEAPGDTTLLTAIETLKPTALIGVSTIGGAFDEQVLKKMAEINDRPIVFPLSNPTSKAECTFHEAVRHTNGKVAFASGSPFDALSFKVSISHPPHSASLIAHTRLTLSFLSQGKNPLPRASQQRVRVPGAGARRGACERAGNQRRRVPRGGGVARGDDVFGRATRRYLFPNHNTPPP